MKSLKSVSILCSVFVIFLLTACGSGGGSGDGGAGTLSMSLTDASCVGYAAVIVTIADVQVHLGGNENSPNSWESVDMPIRPLTINLLDLVNGLREDLGLVDLPAGVYTQMRLIIGDTPGPDDHPFANYVITDTTPAEIHELKIPSGHKTGVKVVHGFTIFQDQLTEVILDFDACRSIVQAGNSDQWLLKPTVKAADPETYAIIEGRVIDDSGSNPPVGINDVLVTIQKYDENAVPLEDKVIIVAATVTDSLKTETGEDQPDSEGFFSIFVEPLAPEEHYYLVAYKDGYSVDTVEIVGLGAGETIGLDEELVLSTFDMGSVIGTVTLTGDFDPEHFSTLSFRQSTSFNGMDEMIEIRSINVLNTITSIGDYFIELPEGDYTLVASTFFDRPTQVLIIDVPTGPEPTNVVFP